MSDRKGKVDELLAKARESLGEVNARAAAGITPEVMATARAHTESIRTLAAGRTVAAERLVALLRDVPEIEDPQVATAFRGLVGVLAALLGVEVEGA
jgi:hypothetical protein